MFMDVQHFSFIEPSPGATSENRQPIQATAEELNLSKLTQNFKKIHVNKNIKLEEGD